MSLYFRVSSVVSRRNILPRRGIEEFYDNVTKEGRHPITGRPWSASELRQKCFSDLHKLWFVLLKEKNMLLTQRDEMRSTKDPTKFPNPYRLKKVKLSMNRIKLVLNERKRTFDEAKQLVRVAYAKQQKEKRMQRQAEYLVKAQQKSPINKLAEE